MPCKITKNILHDVSKSFQYCSTCISMYSKHKIFIQSTYYNVNVIIINRRNINLKDGKCISFIIFICYSQILGKGYKSIEFKSYWQIHSWSLIFEWPLVPMNLFIYIWHLLQFKFQVFCRRQSTTLLQINDATENRWVSNAFPNGW